MKLNFKFFFIKNLDLKKSDFINTKLTIKMAETLRGNKFKDLNMTKEEIERFTEAMKKEEFRKLLVEYAEEISDPKNREIYEQEITKLEEERGMNVTFVHPEPGFCLKTIQNGDKKCFINICKNSIIEKPSCNREPSKSDSKNSKPGLYWSIPHTCSPPREDLDHTGKNKCVVFDVVFNPDAYRMGETNQRFKQLLKDTALDTIENNFRVKLDRNNLKELNNINFKGRPTASVLRKPVNANSNKENENSSAGSEENDPMGQFVDQLKQQYLENQSNSAKLNKPTPVTQKTDINNNNKSSAEENGYTEPKYKMVHRGKFDIEDCTNQTDQRVVNSTRPKELFISIELPLCKSSEQLTLDIFERRLHLESNEPNYKLDLNLPYPIDESESKAKFDKSKRSLNVTLPVVPFVAQLDLSKMNESTDSIEKNNSSASFSPSSSSDSSSSSSLSSSPTPDLTNIRAELEPKSPIAQVKHNLAQPCSAREYKNKLVVKFKVPSYTKESISVHIDSECMFNIRCESTSASGAYIQYYAAYVRFYYVKSLERERRPESGDNDLGSYNCVEAGFEVNELDEDTFEVELEKSARACDQSEIEVKKAYVTLKQSELAEIESNSSDSDDSRSFFIVDIGQDFVNSDLDDTNCANKMSKKDFIMNFSNISNSEQLDEDDDDENESEKEKKEDEQEETKVKFDLDEEMDKYPNVGKKIYEKLKMTKSIVHDLSSLQDKIDEEAEDEKDYLLSRADNKDENEEDDNEEDDNKDSLQKSHDNNSLSSSSNFTDSLGSSLNSSSFGKLKGILKKPRSFSESESSMVGHRDSLPGVSADSKLSVGSCSGNSDENNNDSCSTCKKSVSFNKQVVRNVFKPGSTVGGMKKPNSNKNKKKNNKRKRTLSDPSHDADTLKDSAGDSSAFRNRSVSESSDDSSSIMTNSTESLPETAKPNESQQAEASSKKKKNKKNKKQTAKQADGKVVEEKKNPFDMETMLEWKNQGRLPMEDATHKTNCAVKFKNNIMNDLDD